MRHSLANRISTDAMHPEELRLAIHLLFRINLALKIAFEEESKYPFIEFEEDELRLEPLEQIRLVPPDLKRSEFDYLNSRYENDPASLSDAELERYYSLLCELEGDCEGSTEEEKFKQWVETFKTKINPRKDLPDGKFENFVTGDDIQYEAVGAEEKIWADGVEVRNRALVDAKHNPGDFYTLDSYNKKPFLYGDLEEEFRRYSKIINDNSNPAKELIIYISVENDDSVSLFEYLGKKYNVPVRIETTPWTPE